MIVALLDHLWQSTLFLAAAGLLTLVLRRNAAAVRYALWFAASVKFLVPFSLLVSVGTYLAMLMAPVPSPLPYAMTPAAHALAAVAPLPETSSAAGFDGALVLLGVWALGFATVVAVWGVRWLELRAALRDAKEMPLAVPVRVRSSAAPIEPGLVGIWRPVLFLPEGIAARLSPAELRTVLA
ncbi:MAG TPA: M56 family metallopeptidase, partial [Rhizomicrobium sp.]